MSMWVVAAGFIGSIVGSGFASGREIYQFFSPASAGGLFGLALATVLFALLGMLLLWAMAAWHATSYRALLDAVLGPLSPFADAAFTVFVFLTLAVVLAGGGAFVDQELHAPPWFGLLAFSALAVAIQTSGDERARTISRYLVALLAGLALAVAAAALAVLPWPGMHAATGSDWAVNAGLYVSYNLVLALASLPTFALLPAPQRTRGALAGGLGLGVLAAAIAVSNLLLRSQISAVPLPMLYVAAQVSPFLRHAYLLALAAATLTASISYLTALSGRISQWLPRGKLQSSLLAVCACFVASLGLVQLIATVYPAMGAVALPFWLWFVWRVLQHRLHLFRRRG